MLFKATPVHNISQSVNYFNVAKLHYRRQTEPPLVKNQKQQQTQPQFFQ